MMYTTLNTIKSHSPCSEGWKTLLRGLGKTEADDEPLHLLEILRINRASDAQWSLRAFSVKDCQLFAIGAARHVQHFSVSSENLINMAEAYILEVPVNGVSPPSLSELKSALSKADASEAASGAAWATVAAEEAGVEGVEWVAWVAWVAGVTLEEVIKKACAYVEARRG